MKVGEQVDNKFLFSDIFSVPGIRLMASGQELLAFEFATAEEVSAQADLVSVDGYGIGLKYINWIEEPQYFLNGRTIVVYDGAQSLVIDTLVAAMGEQFVDSSSGL
jgi:hypothetical protein